MQKVTDDLSVHVASSEKAFNEVQNDIEALDGRLDTEIERAKGEEAAIRRELAAGDAATLSSAKSYTDTSVAAEAEERTQGDAATLSSAKTYTDTAVADEAQKRGQGDAATLRAANEHTDAAVAEEASARESGDRATLQRPKIMWTRPSPNWSMAALRRSTRSRSCRRPGQRSEFRYDRRHADRPKGR